MAITSTPYDLANLAQITQGGGAFLDYLKNQREQEDQARNAQQRLNSALTLQDAENAGGVQRVEAAGRLAAVQGDLNRQNELEKVRLLTREQFEKLTTAGKIKQIEDFQKAGVTIDPKKSLDEQYTEAVNQAKSMGSARVKDFTKSIAGLNKQIQDNEAKDAKQRATLARDLAGKILDPVASTWGDPDDIKKINAFRAANKGPMSVEQAIMGAEKLPQGKRQAILDAYQSAMRLNESALQEQDQRRENPEQRRLREQLAQEQRGFDSYTTRNPVGQIGYDHWLQTSGSVGATEEDPLKALLFGMTRKAMKGVGMGFTFGPPAPAAGGYWGDTFSSGDMGDMGDIGDMGSMDFQTPIQDDPGAPMITRDPMRQFIPKIQGVGVIPTAVNPYLQRINRGINVAGGAYVDARTKALGLPDQAAQATQGIRNRVGGLLNRGREVLFSGTSDQRGRALFGDDAPDLLERAKQIGIQRGIDPSETQATFDRAVSGDETAVGHVQQFFNYLRMERGNATRDALSIPWNNIQDDPSGPLSIPWNNIQDDPRAPMITPTTP